MSALAAGHPQPEYANKMNSPRPETLLDVNNKVVMVTGGSRGLGKAMCIAFAQRGAKVVIASRKLEECEKLATEIEQAGGEALALRCHVGEWDGLEPVMNNVIEHFGRIDVRDHGTACACTGRGLDSLTSDYAHIYILGICRGPHVRVWKNSI